jgi:hypothetical protein
VWILNGAILCRASEWDMRKAVPGELIISFEEGRCKVKVTTGMNQQNKQKIER